VKKISENWSKETCEEKSRKRQGNKTINIRCRPFAKEKRRNNVIIANLNNYGKLN